MPGLQPKAYSLEANYSYFQGSMAMCVWGGVWCYPKQGLLNMDTLSSVGRFCRRLWDLEDMTRLVALVLRV